MDNIKLSRLLDCYGDFLTEHSKNVLEQHINDDYSLSEIAERENISRQGVRDGIQRAKSTLLDMESKLGIVDRADRLMMAITQLEQDLANNGELEKYGEQLAAMKNICEEYYGI
ncbi:MAG: DNA-binding protein [Clostridia bacterium]|nr:DNA-binding protein [Clostridia bacterium]